MRILLIGGTGNISTACTQLLLKKGWDVFHVNRGTSINPKIDGVHSFACDINNESSIIQAIGNIKFDVVANFIAFTASDVERDFRLFHNRTKHYIFISSASCYQKPSIFKPITETTPLYNAVWEYSQNKIKAEERLMQLYRDKNFPATIIRPSLTYQYVLPVPLGGWTDYTIVDRIRKGKPIVVHGDGTSLWTITHSADFAIGFEGVAGNISTIGEPFHITSDEVLTWNQMYQSIADAIGCEANIVHIASDYISDFSEKIKYKGMRGSLLGDKSHCAIFDNSKLKTFVPHYNAIIPYQDGIAETIKWFEQDELRMRLNPENDRFIDNLLSNYLNKK